MELDHYNIGNSIFIEKEYVMLIKRDKKNPFCTSSDKLFLKDGKFDNNWVGYSVMKLVEAE